MRVPSSIAPEDKLLFLACRVQVSEEDAALAVQLAERGLDWEYVVETSIRHAVAPLLEHGLGEVSRATGIDLERHVPGSARRDLRRLAEASGRRNRHIFETLRGITAALAAAGAEPVGLKDVQLAVDVYPDPALRPMGDVDLLVRHDDWDAAADALQTLGFDPLPNADVPYMRRYASAQHFRRASDDLWIDLQWNVMQREWDRYGDGSFTYDGAQMWRDAVQISGIDFALRAPALEDMLFHLCLHLEGHRYGELILFCDVAELLRRRGDELDWNRVLDVSRRYDAGPSVAYVLFVTRQLLAAPVPEGVLGELGQPFFPGLMRATLYENLSPLHLKLDEIHRDVHPPQSVMDEFERVARRQAVRAMRADRKVSGLVRTFLEGGGTLVAVDGQPPPRYLPDSMLEPFEPVQLLVLEGDRAVLEEALAQTGFPAGGGGVVTERLAPKDPALTDVETSLSIAPSWVDAEAVLAGLRGVRTTAESALVALRRRLRDGNVDDANATLRLELAALPADTLVAVLAAAVGAAGEDRLIRAVALTDVLAKLPGPVDTARVLGEAARLGVADAASIGLAAARTIRDGVDAGGGEKSVGHLLEWARYGPAEVARHPWLRPGYYFVLSLLLARGAAARGGYVARALVGGQGTPAVLPRILAGAVRGVVRSRFRRRPTARELAYWVGSSTAEQLEIGSQRLG